MEAQGNNSKNGAEILIVEDSATQAERLKFILERHRYRFSAARNGLEAITAIRERLPALVISDIVMPEMDGYQLCSHIKQDKQLENIPVILLTSLTDPVDVMKGLECGADNFIFKPYDERHLLTRIAYMLANRHLRENETTQMGLQIFFAGRKFFITSDRLQILNLLLSTYEAAVQRNRELATAQDELRQLNEHLEEKNRQIQEANRMKSKFLTNMSHELRTPLNSILGFAEFLVDGKPGPLKPKQEEYLGNILYSGRHLLQLINDVLDLAKVEAGKMELKLETFSLSKAVEEVCGVTEPLAQKKGITVNVEIALALGSVTLDQQKLKQVLYNLLSNAFKFTDQGGRVDVLAEPQDQGRFRLSVKDSGIGIKEEDIKRLFTEFEQIESGTSRHYEGTGLGLVLTRKIVELQGGTIDVASETGKGATFTVVLPLVTREKE
jgi:signal transduction histidine kinase